MRVGNARESEAFSVQLHSVSCCSLESPGPDLNNSCGMSSSTRSKRSAAAAGAMNHADLATPVKVAKLNNTTASSAAAPESKGGKQSKDAAATGMEPIAHP